MRSRILVTILSLAAFVVPVSPVHAGGVVSICDEAHLLAALAGGGTVTFSCSGRITLSSSITIWTDTTVDSTGQSVTIDGNHTVRLFYIPAGSSLTLHNLNLVNGRANSDSGGAIYNLGSLVVARGNFESNSAEFHGGAILNYGTADVSDTMFFSNEAGVNGGAIDSTAQLSVQRSRFIENTAGFRGGAVNNYLGAITVEESLFGGNRSSGYGGGLVNDGGNALIRGSRMALNSASGRGGGIKNSGILYVFDSTFSDNRSRGGGGILNEGGTVTVSNSTFSGNSVMEFSGFGGGILNDGGTMGVINSTFSGNGAYFNCGGGISNNGTLTLKNTIVANSPRGDNCDSVNPITDGGGNLSFGDTTCPGIKGDPKLGPLQNNGGPTETMALGAGSAAIDAANDATCAAVPVSGRDQRGVTRPQGAHCDIGAYEATNQLMLWRVFVPIFSRAQ